MGEVLPKNWVKVNIADVLSFTYGKGIPVSELSDSEGYNVYGANGIIGKYPTYMFVDSKVIISCRGAASGAIHKTKPKSTITSNSIILNEIGSNIFDIDYLKNMMIRIDKSSIITGTAQPQITIQQLNKLDIVIAPLAEQQRIGKKLNTLFAQIDNVRRATDRIPQLLKNLRQQILTHAVTGKLTAELRNGGGTSSWKYELASECCNKVQSGGTPKGSKFESSGIPFLKVYNIVRNSIDFESEPQYVSEEIQNSQIKKSITYSGDVVMNIVGPPLNKVAIVPDSHPEWNINQAITLFRPKEYLSNEFLYYFLCEGSSVNSLINQTRGVVGQVNISLSQCRNFTISIPPQKEQAAIVEKVNALFAQLDNIEERYERLTQKLKDLPQSLLHKAFKGELVPQLPTDGSATDLLKDIELLCNNVTKNKHRK